MKGEIYMNYKYIFSMALYEKLKEIVVGKIFCEINDNDELFVKIESFGDIKFDMTIDNITDKILLGYDSKRAAYEVMIQYKKFILKKFLKGRLSV